ncbi:hypothetical protein D9613_010530 [Agrocybe pediades]|uniref:Uncharacterized protein n=1 Tax=Agrocybe pediades TaxID=84607 RepID=A0A8H4QFZ2_9AGAR|nr:hypothetical protein D9613_010530 [Agrocybe pediades]
MSTISTFEACNDNASEKISHPCKVQENTAGKKKSRGGSFFQAFRKKLKFQVSGETLAELQADPREGNPFSQGYVQLFESTESIGSTVELDDELDTEPSTPVVETPVLDSTDDSCVVVVGSPASPDEEQGRIVTVHHTTISDKKHNEVDMRQVSEGLQRRVMLARERQQQQSEEERCSIIALLHRIPDATVITKPGNTSYAYF